MKKALAGLLHLAEREGFEPSIRYRIHTFQACSFSRSDTSPLTLSLLPLDLRISVLPMLRRSGFAAVY